MRTGSHFRKFSKREGNKSHATNISATTATHPQPPLPHVPALESFARIKVVGVGGGGSNAVNRMIEEKLSGIEFVAINTDAQRCYSNAPKRVRIGDKLTRGLGAGGNPRRARKRQSRKKNCMDSARRGHGLHHFRNGRRHRHWRGTCRGANCQELGALTIGVVTDLSPLKARSDQRRLSRASTN